MGFLKTSFWASLATAFTMLCGLISTKYVALIIGTEGMAYVGQFANATTILSLFAVAACSTGVVKYVAQFTNNITVQKSLTDNAFLLIGFSSAAVSIITIVLAGRLSQNSFKTNSFTDVFLLYGLLVFFPAFNAIAVSILNGLQRIKLLALLGMVTSLFNLLFIIAGGYYFGIKGVLVANLFAALFAFGFYAYHLEKLKLFPRRSLFNSYKVETIKLLLGYTAMSVVSGVVAPALQLFVRSKLLHNFDANTAGLWQANTRLSDYYLNFIYTVIGIYYLPKLSATEDPKELKKEIRLGFLRIIPIVLVITMIIWLCRNLIVEILLTNSFKGMLVLLKWQLIGDIIKIGSWLLGYIFWAKALRTTYIITELTFSVIFVLLSYFFINHYGIMGTVYAFTLNYLLYLLCLTVILRKYIF